MEFDALHSIAKNSLNSCLTPYGYTAGNHHFVDIWARDAFFACLGDLSGEGCLRTLQTFKDFQREDGLVPYRVRRSSLSLMKYFGKPTMLKNPVADFRSYQSGRTVYDGGLLFILIFSLRILEMGNINEVNKFSKSIFKALEYYRRRFGGGLIKEGFQAEWVDQVLKSGNVLYTNILYLASLKNLIKVINLYPDTFKDLSQESLVSQYNYLKSKLYEKLWNGKFFSDFHNFKRHDYLASFPNLLAIIFDVTTEKESLSILKNVEKHCVLELGVTSNYPKYPWYLIPIQNYLLGLRDYHNGLFWLQPWITYICVLKKVGRVEDSISEMTKLGNIILRDNVVSENYDNSWNPTKRFWYISEAPFSWNSGMILWAIKMLK